MAFGAENLINESYNVLLQGRVLNQIKGTFNLNGYLLQNIHRGKWMASAHIDKKITSGRGLVASLMTLQPKMGSLSPSLYYGLFKAIVEPHFIYATETYAGVPRYSTALIDDLQLKFARCALGLARTLNRWATLADLGQLPLSWKLLHIWIRFLVYALTCGDDRPVNQAVRDFMLLAYSHCSGWFRDRRASLDSFDDVGLQLTLAIDAGREELLTLPEKLYLAMRSRFARELKSALQSNRWDALALNPPVLRRKNWSFTCAPYATLAPELAIAIARMRHAEHKLNIETERLKGIPQAERFCTSGEDLETEWHVLVECASYDNLRDVFWISVLSARNCQPLRRHDGGLEVQAGTSPLHLFRMALSPLHALKTAAGVFVKRVMVIIEQRWKLQGEEERIRNTQEIDELLLDQAI